jgi:hypothetical protein
MAAERNAETALLMRHLMGGNYEEAEAMLDSGYALQTSTYAKCEAAQICNQFSFMNEIKPERYRAMIWLHRHGVELHNQRHGLRVDRPTLGGGGYNMEADTLMTAALRGDYRMVIILTELGHPWDCEQGTIPEDVERQQQRSSGHSDLDVLMEFTHEILIALNGSRVARLPYRGVHPAIDMVLDEYFPIRSAQDDEIEELKAQVAMLLADRAK